MARASRKYLSHGSSCTWTLRKKIHRGSLTEKALQGTHFSPQSNSVIPTKRVLQCAHFFPWSDSMIPWKNEILQIPSVNECIRAGKHNSRFLPWGEQIYSGEFRTMSQMSLGQTGHWLSYSCHPFTPVTGLSFCLQKATWDHRRPREHYSSTGGAPELSPPFPNVNGSDHGKRPNPRTERLTLLTKLRTSFRFQQFFHRSLSSPPTSRLGEKISEWPAIWQSKGNRNQNCQVLK